MERSVPGRGHRDPYRVLGVDADASRQDVARAYRHAVQRVHPDARPADPRAAAARFRELTDAYDLLTDPARRAAYDRAHHPAGEAGGQPSAPRYRSPAERGAGPRHPLAPPPGQPIWAGPVHIEEPPAAPASEHDPARPPAADVEDPPVILGTWPGRRRGWPW
jgi:curved DNA-binding protein CbpA